LGLTGPRWREEDEVRTVREHKKGPPAKKKGAGNIFLKTWARGTFSKGLRCERKQKKDRRGQDLPKRIRKNKALGDGTEFKGGLFSE